jgi:hypothetical protein
MQRSNARRRRGCTTCDRHAVGELRRRGDEVLVLLGEGGGVGIAEVDGTGTVSAAGSFGRGLWL